MAREQYRRVTQDDVDLFLRLYNEGLGRNEIARQMDRPHGTVTNIARRVGVRFDTADAEVAIETNKAKAAEIRSRLAVKLALSAEALAEQMWEPAVLGNFGGRNNTWSQVDVPEPPPADKRALASAAATLLDRSLKLDEYDRHQGDDAAKSMLSGLELVIRQAAREQEADSAGDDAPGE